MLRFQQLVFRSLRVLEQLLLPDQGQDLPKVHDGGEIENDTHILLDVQSLCPSSQNDVICGFLYSQFAEYLVYFVSSIVE